MDPAHLSLACEFAVASRLFFKGYYASVTLKNYPKYDIFVHNPKTGKSVGVDVKGVGKDQIDLPAEDDGVTKVYVNAHDPRSLRFYVDPSKDAPLLKKRVLEEYQRTHPRATFVFANFEDPAQYEDRWELLGLEMSRLPRHPRMARVAPPRDRSSRSS